MVWSLETSCGYEQDKIACLAVHYLQGARYLDLGCGMRKVWPSAIGIDASPHSVADIQGNIADLSLFSDASVDAIFSSHALEDFPREQVPAVLTEWTRVLKVGGHLVLYVPSANLYPKVGEPGANPAHQWDIYPGDIEKMLKDIPGVGWELLEAEERSGGTEYSLFIVVRKAESGWTENVWQRNPGGKKRALVIRYGGIGDMIQTASIFPELQKQGYHVTLNCRAETACVLERDPHINEWMVQATDFVPNQALAPYWQEISQRYDKVVNLCESIEGALLLLADRLQSKYPAALRRKMIGGVNYLERTHDIADVPHNYAPKFYYATEERSWALQEARCGGPVILWAISGSSPHKVWPWTHIVISWLLQRTPAHIFITADPGIGKQLQDAILEELQKSGADLSRVHGVAGKWTIRQTLTFAIFADCVVGPETGVMNAVCTNAVPKVIYLSHSSETNLTRDWVNTRVLTPEADRAPCYPCHQLHPDWSTCHQDEATNAALCAAGISPDRVFRAIALAIGGKPTAEAAD